MLHPQLLEPKLCTGRISLQAFRKVSVSFFNLPQTTLQQIYDLNQPGASIASKRSGAGRRRVSARTPKVQTTSAAPAQTCALNSKAPS